MPTANSKSPERGYTQIGPLNMYWERQGQGAPLLLLHAGFSTIDSSFGKLRPLMANQFATIGVEQQAHGHTPDIDRPLTFEQMVDDTAALLRQLNVTQTDIFGWSNGGTVALGLAVRHPALVRRVAIIGAGDGGPDADTAEFKQRLATLKPDNQNIKPFHDAYQKVAPAPDHWPVMIDKVKTMCEGFEGWPKESLRSLRAPLMVMLGDKDIIRLEHALELFRMVPDGRLAVLPGSDHSAPVMRTDWIIPMLTNFFTEEKKASP